VRTPEGAHLETRDGTFMTSALPVAGFAVIEAADLALGAEPQRSP
jgi:hypothetical protein